jgi:hypothetical protein
VGQRGRHFIFAEKLLFWGAFIVSTLFCDVANQITQKKVGLVRCIAQAKNGGELFWEQKFHAANGNAQPRTQAALHFFLSS